MVLAKLFRSLIFIVGALAWVRNGMKTHRQWPGGGTASRARTRSRISQPADCRLGLFGLRQVSAAVPIRIVRIVSFWDVKAIPNGSKSVAGNSSTADPYCLVSSVRGFHIAMACRSLNQPVKLVVWHGINSRLVGTVHALASPASVGSVFCGLLHQKRPPEMHSR
jgi:hypothetical protein